LFPKSDQTPSERTIESLANHFILSQLNEPKAWMISPTGNEERTLGYDSAIRRAKLVVIQYKRVKTRVEGLSVSLNASQHVQLTKVFPKRPSPYVFFAFGSFRSYRDLDQEFLTKGSPLPFEAIQFVDAHSVPAGTTTLQYDPPGMVVPVANGQAGAAVSNVWEGPDLVRQIKTCLLGDIRDLRERVAQLERAESVTSLNMLLWALP
jgi:hypothetical protein